MTEFGKTRRERLKSALYLMLEKRKVLEICLGLLCIMLYAIRTVICYALLMKNSGKTGAFRARKTLQKFGYMVLGHVGALSPKLCLLLSKAQLPSDITSKFG